MPQEDKVKRMIDQIGLALARLFQRLLGTPYDPAEMAAEFPVLFKKELDIELDKLLLMDNDEALELLVNGKRFSADNLRELGNVLYELAKITRDESRRHDLHRKVCGLFTFVKANSNATVYFDVEMKIKELGCAE